jgi:hypothetical protein
VLRSFEHLFPAVLENFLVIGELLSNLNSLCSFLLYTCAGTFFLWREKIMSRGRYGFLLSCFSLILFGWMSQSFLAYLHRFV